MALLFFIALRQLWDRKLLNSIAIGGVSLGVLVLIGMNGIMQGFQLKFKAEILKVSPHVIVFDKELGQAESILTHHEKQNSLETSSLIEKVFHQQPSDRVTRIKRPFLWMNAIESIPEVEAACVGLVGQAVVSLGSLDLGVDLRGVNPAQQEKCTPLSGYVISGSWQALSVTADSIALGSGVAEKLGAQVGDQVRMAQTKGQAQALKVVAIFESDIPPIDKSRVYVNIVTSQKVLGRPNAIGRIEIRLRDPFDSISVAARLEKMMKYDNESWQETNANFLSLFDMQNMIVNMVIGAILIVGGFGILAVQIMIVLQKTRDISILRSVGLTRRDILFIFLIQGFIIALIGACLGDFFGWRLVEFLGNLKVKQEGLVKSSTFLVAKDPLFYWYGLGFALLTGMFASLLPAWRGSKVEPVDVLRGQVG